MPRQPKTLKGLQGLLPEAAIVEALDRPELVIYTGLKVDDDGRLVPLEDDDY